MDGQTPSGFTQSTYRGMDPSANTETGDGTDGTDGEEEVVEEPAALSDLFALAAGDGGFDLFAFIGICLAYWEVCFNPLSWFG